MTEQGQAQSSACPWGALGVTCASLVLQCYFTQTGSQSLPVPSLMLCRPWPSSDTM